MPTIWPGWIFPILLPCRRISTLPEIGTEIDPEGIPSLNSFSPASAVRHSPTITNETKSRGGRALESQIVERLLVRRENHGDERSQRIRKNLEKIDGYEHEGPQNRRP